MVGAIWVVSTPLVADGVFDAGACDHERDVPVLRVGAAVLGDFPLAAGVDGAVLADAEDVRYA
jgi:hypothetical protein